MTWLPAKVGCHWFCAEHPTAVISTFVRNHPARDQMRSGYQLMVNCEPVAEFSTLRQAQQFCEAIA